MGIIDESGGCTSSSANQDTFGSALKSEEPTMSKEKNTFEEWQESTLRTLDDVAVKAFKEYEVLLALDQDLARTVDLIDCADSGTAQILARVVDLLNILVQPTALVHVSVASEPEELPFDPFIRIEQLHFSARSENALENDGLKYLGQIVFLSEKQLLRIPNFGKKSLDEVKRALFALYGVQIGMKHPALEAMQKTYPVPGYLLRYA